MRVVVDETNQTVTLIPDSGPGQVTFAYVEGWHLYQCLALLFDPKHDTAADYLPRDVMIR